MPAKPDYAGPNQPSARELGALFRRLDRLYPTHPLDCDADQPFQVLVATILSARTQDPTTNGAMRRLWGRITGREIPEHDPGRPQRHWPRVTADQLLALDEKTIAELIRPVGFYLTKAKHLRKMSALLIERLDGKVPKTREELMELPGVGRKVANLVLNICWDIPAICVDIHVHRISNRLGWVETQTPEQTESALTILVPEKYWTTLNRVLVNHGQQVCKPQSPWCSHCIIYQHCLRIDVVRSR